MPYIQIRTPNGTPYGIHSSDPELLGRWFTETLRRESPGMDNYDFTMRVQPMYMPTPDGRGQPDWSPNMTDSTHDFSFKPTLDGLIAVLSRLREELGSSW